MGDGSDPMTPPPRPARLSLIAHADHRLMSPLADDRLDALVALLELPPGAHVVELCCGKAEILRRVLAAYPTATGLGVDRDATLLDAARAADPADRLTLRRGDAWETDRGGDPPADLLISVGGAWPDGDPDKLWPALRDRTCPGGLVLVGDGIYHHPPDPAEMVADGWDPTEPQPTHADQVARAWAAGLSVLYTTTSTLPEWDAYEGLYLRAVERWVAAHPDAPEADAMRRYIRWWHRRYLDWRRGCLGFGWYLCRRPAD